MQWIELLERYAQLSSTWQVHSCSSANKTGLPLRVKCCSQCFVPPVIKIGVSFIWQICPVPIESIKVKFRFTQLVSCSLANIYDPLSENPAHPVFYENWDKPGSRYIDVQLCTSEKMEAIGCLVPELWSETHSGCKTQVFSSWENAMFLRCYGISVYYRVLVKRQLKSWQRQWWGLHCVYRQKDNRTQTGSLWNCFFW